MWIYYTLILSSCLAVSLCTPAKRDDSASTAQVDTTEPALDNSQQAIIAIQIVNSNGTDGKNTTKRTIESSLGYGGYQGNNFYYKSQDGKFEIYPYSQQDIPPLGAAGRNPNVKIQSAYSYSVGAPGSQQPQSYQSYQQNAAPQGIVYTRPQYQYQQPIQGQHQQYSAGQQQQQIYPTTLFSTLNHGQIGGLSQYPVAQQAGYSGQGQQNLVPVIILRVYSDQLTNPGAEVYPNLPENNPYAGQVNSLNLQSLLSNYIQNYQANGYQQQGQQQGQEAELPISENYPDDAHTRIVYTKKGGQSAGGYSYKAPVQSGYAYHPSQAAGQFIPSPQDRGYVAATLGGYSGNYQNAAASGRYSVGPQTFINPGTPQSTYTLPAGYRTSPAVSVSHDGSAYAQEGQTYTTAQPIAYVTPAPPPAIQTGTYPSQANGYLPASQSQVATQGLGGYSSAGQGQGQVYSADQGQVYSSADQNQIYSSALQSQLYSNAGQQQQYEYQLPQQQIAYTSAGLPQGQYETQTVANAASGAGGDVQTQYILVNQPQDAAAYGAYPNAADAASIYYQQNGGVYPQQQDDAGSYNVDVHGLSQTAPPVRSASTATATEPTKTGGAAAARRPYNYHAHATDEAKKKRSDGKRRRVSSRPIIAMKTTEE